MNKMIKGSVVGAAGVALLMGGFGTYALWQDAAALPSATVSAGTLDLAPGTASWVETSSGTAVPFDPATGEVVPGDVVELRQPLTIDAEGTNLAGQLALDLTAITQTDWDGKLGIALDLGAPVGFTRVGTTDAYTFTDAAAVDGTTVNSVITFTFNDLTGFQAQDGINATAALTGAKFTLTQTR